MRLDSQGVSLAYDDRGGPGAPPVVLLHGLGDARSTWRGLVARLTPLRRVVALDFRGHGGSGHAAGTYTLEHHLADAIALCDHVLERPAVVVGHSLGGVVAHTMALRRPELVRGVLLEDPPLFPRGDSPAIAFFSLLRDFTMGMQLRGARIEEYEAVLNAVPSPRARGSAAGELGPEGTRLRAVEFSRIDPDVFLPALDGTGLDGARPDLPLPCPALVIRADPSLGAAFTAENEKQFRITNPEAQVTVVLGAGHLVHEEEPERFASELEAFVGRL